MSLFAWDDKYSVGCVQIDDQHKQLFKMAEELHAAMMGGKGKEAMSGLFSRLVAYTRYHFTTEEGIMRQHEYPGYEQHHLLHEKLTNQVLELQTKVAAGKGAVTMETLNFLSDWLRNHIQIQDQKVGHHIRQHKADLVRA